MKSGNVFIDKEGTDINKIEVGKRNEVLRNYIMMREDAGENEDKFFSVYTKEWEDLFCNIYSPNNPYWKGVDMNYVALLQTFVYRNKFFGDISEFDALPEPESHGGFGYDGHPLTGYVHNPETWEEWHCKFYYEHPEEIDWDGTNGIMPCRDKVIEILREELLAFQARLVPNGSNNLGLPHLQFLRLKNTRWESADDETIVSDHNDIVIRHQGEEMKAYSEKIGSLICSANYYHRETELERLEKDHGNTNVSVIYSIRKDNRYQFISIDTAHGKFELCDATGTHRGEIRFDGSPNGTATVEEDHGLRCIAEWKRRYNK